MGKNRWVRGALGLVLALALLLTCAFALADGDTPSFTLTATQVQLGEMFEANIEGIAGVDHYMLVLSDSEGERVYASYAVGEGDIWLATSRAEAGQYTIVLYALNDDWDEENPLSQSAPQAVTITENTTLGEEDVLLEVHHRDPLIVGDRMYVSAWARTDKVYIVMNGVEYDTRTLMVWRSTTGSTELSATAVFPHEDGTYGEANAEPVTVTFGSYGDAGSDVVLGELGPVTEGEDFTITFTGAPNADASPRAFVLIEDSLDESVLAYEAYEDADTRSFTIPGTDTDEQGNSFPLFEAGRAYKVYVGFDSQEKGYAPTYAEGYFAVGASEEPTITVKVNGQDEVASMERHAEAHIDITAHGLDRLILHYGDQEEQLHEWGEWNDWMAYDGQDNIAFDLGYWATAGFWAEGFYTDEQTGEEVRVVSNVVLVNAVTEGDPLPLPDVFLPRTVRRGDLLTLTMNDWPEEVEWYWLAVNHTDDWDELIHVDWWSGEREVYIPTGNLEPGMYKLAVGNGAVGRTDLSRQILFEVLEPAEELDDIVWGISNENPWTMEIITVSVCAPGAENIHGSIWHEVDGWGIEEDFGDLLYLNDLSFPVAGDLHIDVTATYEDGTVRTDSRTVTVRAEDSLASFVITAPETLGVEQALTFSFPTVENATGYYVRITPANEGWNALWEQGFDAGQEITLATDGSDGFTLEPDRMYAIGVQATAPRYNSAVAEARVFVSDGSVFDEEQVALTVNGETEETSVLAQQSFLVSVAAPGASHVEVYDGEWGEYGLINGAWADTRDLTQNATFVARAWFEGEEGEDGYYVYSNFVGVDVENNGTPGSYALTVPATVVLGQPLTVTLGAAEHGLEYHVRICESPDEEGEYFFYSAQPGAFDLPTYMLEAGRTYYVTCNCRGQLGYDWNGTSRAFTVLAPEEGYEPAQIAFSVSKTSAAAGEDVLLTVCAPGADWIEVSRNGDTGFWSFPMEDADRPELGFAFHSTSDFNTGENTLVARARFGEEWVEADPITLQVGAVTGRLVGATFDAPAVLIEGEDLTVSFPAVENATEYSFWINDDTIEEGESQVIGTGNLLPDQTYTLPAALFQAGHTYRIGFDVNAPGYEGEHIDRNVLVLAADELPAEPGAVLTLDGATGTAEEPFEVPISQDFEICIRALGEDATATALYCEGNWDYRQCPLDENGAPYYEPRYDGHTFWTPGEYVFLGMYTTDEYDPEDEDWADGLTWHYTNMVYVNALENEAGDILPAPEYEVLNPNAAVGEMLRVRITNLEDYADYDLALEEFNADLWWRAEDRWYGRMGADEDGVIWLSTAELEPGITYELDVRVWSAGYRQSGALETFYFTPAEPQLDEAGIAWSFTAETRADGKVYAYAGETFRFSAYAPGANHVAVVILDEDGNENWRDERDESGLSNEWNENSGCERTFRAVAWFEGEDDHVSERTVVILSDGQVPEVNVSAAPVYNVGDDITFTISGGEGAEWYGVSLKQMMTDGDDRGDCLFARSYDAAGTYTISANDLERALEPDALYNLDVDAHKPRYDTSRADAWFYVSGEGETLGGSVTITVNGQTGSVFVHTREVITTTISAPGAESIELFTGDAWRWANDPENAWEDMGGVNGITTRTDKWDNPGGGLYMARAWFPDENGGHWAYSNPVSVYANASGKAGAPETFSVPESVTRGDPLTITLSEVPNASRYWFSIDEICESEEDEGWSWGNEVRPGEIVLPTDALIPGRYTVNLWVSEAGKEQSYTWRELTVNEGSVQGAQARLSKTEVATGEDYYISVYAPGAEEIRVYDRDNPEESLEEFWNWTDRDWEIWTERMNHPGRRTYYYSALYDGEWTEPVEIGAVIVRASASLPTPTLTLSKTVLGAGDSLTITLGEIAGADNYQLWISDASVTDRDNGIYWVEESSPITVTFPAGFFPEGGAYSVGCSVKKVGCEESGQNATFVVTYDAQPDSSLWVDGTKDDRTITTGQGVRVSVAVPENATGLRVTDGEGNCYFATRTESGWLGNNGEVMEGDWAMDWAWGYAHQATLFATYTTLDIAPESEWWNNITAWAGFSNAVTLNVTQAGSLPTPQLSYSDSVTRGDLLAVTIANFAQYTQEGVGFEWQAYDAAEDEWFNMYFGTEGVIYVPTASLETANGSKTYDLYVGVEAPGWQSARRMITFTVTEPAASDVRFRVTRTSLLTREWAQVSLYAPGATGVRVLNSNGVWLENDPDRPEHCEGGWGDNNQDLRAVFTPVVCYGDPENENDWTVRDDLSVTVTISAPYGRVSPVMVSGPATVRPGEDVQITLSEERDYDEVYISVRRMRDDLEVWAFGGDSGVGEYWIPAVTPDGDHYCLPGGEPILEAGELYCVNLFFSKLGYSWFGTDLTFLVEDGQSEPSVALTINESAQPATVAVWESFRVQATAPEDVTAIRITIDNNTWHFEGHTVDTELNWGNPGVQAVYAQTYTGVLPEGLDSQEAWDTLIDWGGIASNVVALNVTFEDVCPAPAFAATPESVQRGEIINIRITNADPDMSYYGFFGANGAWLEHTPWDGVDTIILNTIDLAPGDYTLEVYSDGKPGVVGNTTKRYITVTEPEGMVFSLGKTDLLIGEWMDVAIVAPGDPETITLHYADGTEAYNPYNANEIENGAVRDWACIWYEAGTYDVYATARYADGSEITAGPVRVTVTQLGQADAPTFDAPTAIWQGESLTISMDPVENATSYSYGISGIEDNDDVECGEYTIDTSGLEPGVYSLYVFAGIAEPGYAGNTTERQFIVVDPSAPVLNLPDSLTTIDDEAFMGISAQIVRVPQGTTTIGRNAFANCPNLAFVYVPAGVQIDAEAFANSPFVTVITE